MKYGVLLCKPRRWLYVQFLRAMPPRAWQTKQKSRGKNGTNFRGQLSVP